MPRDGLLPVFPETVEASLADTIAANKTTRIVTGELRALHGQDLTAALERFLRAITTGAALTDAVLETRAFRMGNPRAADASLVCATARRLWKEGFQVTFGPAWKPVPAADLALGIGGPGGDLESFICKTNLWEVVPRRP